MLGTVRFILAVLVVLNHLWLPAANRVGAHAVVAFYMISGDLMTKVIDDVYGHSLRGAARYLANRALRIYPIYWFCLFSTLILIATNGEAFRVYSLIAVPDIKQLFQNVTLIDLGSSEMILVPPAWSLTVEFAYYVAMIAGLSRHRHVSIAWFSASLIYTAWLIASGAPFSQRTIRSRQLHCSSALAHCCTGIEPHCIGFGRHRSPSGPCCCCSALVRCGWRQSDSTG